MKLTSLPDSSRRLKSCSDSDDRISDLPDSIIGHILSFLPTKDAVATGVLSQRWTLLWTNVINLDFCYPGVTTIGLSAEKEEDKSTKFVQFVKYVLLLHKPGCLNKFSLIWKRKCVPFYVNEWISAAVARNVHQLFVSVSNSDLLIQVQRSMFTCQELQSLELNCKIWISPEIVFSLPKLERLKLISVYFRSEEVFSKLLAGCPMLKYLYTDMKMAEMLGYLNRKDIDNIYDIDGSLLIQVPKSMFSCDGLQSLELNCNLCISSEITFSLPKLESLTLISVYFQHEETFRKLVGSCPVLKYLHIDMHIGQMVADLDKNLGDREDGIAFEYVVSSTTLRHLELYVHNRCEAIAVTKLRPGGVEEELSYCNSVVEAVSAFDCAKTLILSGDVIWAVSYATNNLRTRFKSLTKLKVTIGCCYWSSLQDFIKLSSGLEVLTIKKGDKCMSRGLHHKTSNWKKPKQVPMCLSNSLKTVSVDAYDGGDDELAMVAYILKHGSALRVMTICFSGSITDLKTKSELVQQIYELPKMSPVCELEFWLDGLRKVVVKFSPR